METKTGGLNQCILRDKINLVAARSSNTKSNLKYSISLRKAVSKVSKFEEQGIKRWFKKTE